MSPPPPVFGPNMRIPNGGSPGGVSGGIQQQISHIICETSLCGLQSHLLKTSAAPDPIRFPGVPLALEEGRPATRLAQRSTQKRKGVTDAFCAWRPLQAGGMAPPPEEGRHPVHSLHGASLQARLPTRGGGGWPACRTQHNNGDTWQHRSRRIRIRDPVGGIDDEFSKREGWCFSRHWF